MEGEHLLDGKGLLVFINNVDDLTLRGHSDTDTIIKCSSNTRGIEFYSGNRVTIYGITITGCGQQEVSPLLFINIASLYIHHITLYNNTYNTRDMGGTLYIYCDTDTHITITNSVFTNNTVGGNGGGLFIFASTDVHNNITITNSVFTNNIVGTNGSGLYVFSYTDIHSNINITNSIFTNNTVGCNGGGLYIFSYADTHNNITITNSVLTNNTVGGDGGGLYIYSGTDAHNNITITSSVFTNNTVGGDGGGVYMCFVIDIHNNITITNSTFNTNALGGHGYGGGLYIFSGIYNIHNNIIITNSAFTNNHVAGGFGGGLLIYPFTDNVTISKSAFTNNSVGSSGGGLLIYSQINIYNRIIITNNTFNNNTVGGHGGGVFIYVLHSDANSITITNSVFTNNRVGGKGGGVCIYIFVRNTSIDIHNNITITNSVFNNNRVGVNGGGLFLHTFTNIHDNIITTNSTSALTNKAVFGVGHELIIDSFTHTHNYINITNSAFTNNTVGGYGGGLYIYSDKDIHVHNNITITNSAFTNNTVNSAGGGLFIYILYSDNANNIALTNSAFTKNTIGGDGGGMHIFMYTTSADIHNNITIMNSAFTNNVVGSNGGGLLIYYHTNIDNNMTIINSIFTDNNGSGLFLFFTISKVHVIFSQVTISENNGSGIQALNHVNAVFTEGHSIVANNSSPSDGGGIYLGKDSYLTTSNGGHVSFINNTAHRYGGAIYSLDSDNYLFFTLKVYAYSVDQCTVYDLSATFINNSAAIAGDQLYGGVFILCQKTFVNDNYLQHSLNCTHVPETIKTNVSSVHPLSPVSSYPLVVCPCVNGTVNCTVRSLDRQVYPGQILHVSLVTVGLCGGVSPGTVVVDHDKRISLISNATADYTSTSCTTLYYTVKLNTKLSNTMITLDVSAVDSDSLNNSQIYIYMYIHLSILPCPLGLRMDFTSGECVCNNDITIISGVICNISWMPYPIQRSGNNWISHQYTNCTIAHIGCPFDYCNTLSVKFNFNESDIQCNYNRSGILCGKCIQGLSLMLGSNRCANCTDTTLVSVSIIILAAVAGIVLVILLIVLNLTVSVGSINGLLFYANLVKLNESVFFSRGNVPVVTQFISWCNLDMGFEYCFLSGLDGYVKTWLQFVFPLYVWLLVVVIIVACRYSGRLSRLCGRNAVPVLATLVLMSYTKLSRTVTDALMMNTLQCREYKWNVWNVDGNIEYLGGKHIVLFAVSLLFLVTGLVYTGLVFSSQWLQLYSGKCCKSTRDPVVRFKPLIDAYTGPFKDKYRFWTGLCLMVRLILTVVFSFTTTLQSKLNNYIIVVTVGAMSMFGVGTRAYKDKRITVLETFSFINLICLSLMMILFTESYHDTVSVNVIVSVSVSIEILLFVIIVTVHCFLAFNKVLPNCKLYCHKTRAPEPSSEDELSLIAGDTEEESPTIVINRREELIFDFYLNEEHS